MRIIILGARGRLGLALSKEFSPGNEVIAWDSVDLDITAETQVKEKLLALRPEVVINAAAYNAVDKIEENEVDYVLAEKVNGQALKYLAQVCNELDSILVHYSSEYVFAGDNKEGYVEAAETSPVNKYGETKLLGEKMVQVEAKKYYLIRLSRLFGPMEQSAMSKKSFVGIMLDLVEKKGKTELDLVAEGMSCPTYSLDLAKLTNQLLIGKQSFGIYHGANSGSCNWYEFAQEIFKIKGLEVKCNPVSAENFSYPAKRPKYAELINTKLSKQRIWQEALAEYLLIS